MAHTFDVAAQQVTVGTATNNVLLQFFYDFNDHSLCKCIVTPTGTLAAATEVVFTRKGLATSQTTTLPALDTGTAIPLELNSGGVQSSGVVHGAGFGV